jgi:hypothetical protein
MFRTACFLVLLLLARVAGAQAITAPSFDRIPDTSRIVLMPLDVELFSISAGGVPEPQAQWTSMALEHLRASLQRRESAMGNELAEADREDATVTTLNHLHGAVASAIALHHYTPAYALPTKKKQLAWHIGADTAPLRARTGADYALFLYVRDSYATTERKAAIVLGALLGVGMGGGIQIGYASLVDLTSGEVVWFNRLSRGTGDLREEGPAEETIDALLDHFPR